MNEELLDHLYSGGAIIAECDARRAGDVPGISSMACGMAGAMTRAMAPAMHTRSAVHYPLIMNEENKSYVLHPTSYISIPPPNLMEYGGYAR